MFQEFLKFQKQPFGYKIFYGSAGSGKSSEAMGDEMTGVVVNPFGVDLQLNIARSQNQN